MLVNAQLARGHAGAAALHVTVGVLRKGDAVFTQEMDRRRGAQSRRFYADVYATRRVRPMVSR